MRPLRPNLWTIGLVSAFFESDALMIAFSFWKLTIDQKLQNSCYLMVYRSAFCDTTKTLYKLLNQKFWLKTFFLGRVVLHRFTIIDYRSWRPWLLFGKWVPWKCVCGSPACSLKAKQWNKLYRSKVLSKVELQLIYM